MRRCIPLLKKGAERKITINVFRVECNHGTKLFGTGLEAYLYFLKMKAKRFKVELWLVTQQKNGKRLYVTQELIAY